MKRLNQGVYCISWFPLNLTISSYFTNTVWSANEYCDLDKDTNTNTNTNKNKKMVRGELALVVVDRSSSCPWSTAAPGKSLLAFLHSPEIFTQTFFSSFLLRRDTGTWCWQTECSFFLPWLILNVGWGIGWGGLALLKTLILHFRTSVIFWKSSGSMQYPALKVGFELLIKCNYFSQKYPHQTKPLTHLPPQSMWTWLRRKRVGLFAAGVESRCNSWLWKPDTALPVRLPSLQLPQTQLSSCRLHIFSISLR